MLLCSADTYLKCSFFGRQDVFCKFIFSAMKEKADWIQEVKIMEDIFIMEERKIRRGDIYHADLNPVFGSEQGGYRPVLVIQNNRGNQYSPTVIVAAITSRPKSKMPTHVPIPADMQGLEKDSVVLLEQVRTLDKKRLGDYIGTLDRQQMMKVDKALCSSTGMRKRDKPILMCLCPICAKPFYDSKEHFIQRADKTQNLKDTCMFCNSRQGYDYLIRKRYCSENKDN